MKRLALLTLLTLLTPGCVTGGAGSGPANVPNLSLRDVDGRRHTLSDSIGRKVTVMSFWATWCMPCRQELTMLQELYREHARDGLAVLAINGDGPETVGRVRPYVKQSGWTFTVLLDSENRVAALYNPRKQMPMLHVFDRAGRMAYTHTTFQPGHGPEVKRKILDILRSERGAE